MSTADRSVPGSPARIHSASARAAGRGDADRVEAGADEEVPQLGGLAEDVLVVRRETLRAVVEHLDASVAEGWNPELRALHEDREMIPVLFEKLELEGVGQRVGGDPGFRVGLEPADDQAAHFLLEVGVSVWVAQDRQVAVDPDRKSTRLNSS